MLAAAFLAAAVSAPGQTFFVALYVPEIARGLGLTAVAISSVYGMATLAGAALLPFVGTWADRWTAPRFLGAVVGGLGVALMALASASGPVMLGLAWTALRCLGQGAVGVGLLAAISRTFVDRRGRALAIGNLGHPFGEFLFPAAIAALLAVTSWRQSLLTFAVLYLVVFAPMVAVGLRAVPRALPAAVRQPERQGSVGAEGFRLGEAVRTREFWVATAVLTAAPVVVTALLFHQVAFFEGMGLSRLDTPVALMYFAAAQVAATVLTGRLVDQGALRGSLALSCLALAGSPVCLALPLPEAMRVGLYGSALGYATGGAAVAGGALWPAYFGLAAIGKIRALTSGIRNAATAGAPLLVAIVVERSDLASALLVLVSIGVVALLLTLSLPQPRRAVLRTAPLESGGDL
ncbi:MAG: MFS transporter [Vicinamibacterales bacterium]